MRAELTFTTDDGQWQKRKWDTVPATLDAVAKKATATLPEGVTVYYLNLVDDRGLYVSTEHEVTGGNQGRSCRARVVITRPPLPPDRRLTAARQDQPE